MPGHALIGGGLTAQVAGGWTGKERDPAAGSNLLPVGSGEALAP
jgi:hypothetical protein